MDCRVDRLEIKVMELENTIEKLNKVIADQYKIIERLELGQQAMAKRITTLSEIQDSEEQYQPPPHY